MNFSTCGPHLKKTSNSIIPHMPLEARIHLSLLLVPTSLISHKLWEKTDPPDKYESVGQQKSVIINGKDILTIAFIQYAILKGIFEHSTKIPLNHMPF